jgi:cysteine synthase
LPRRKGVKAEILVKLEFFNRNASVKDRIGVSTIDAMEASGVIRPQTAPAIQASRSSPRRGYRPILVTPDSMSIERHKMLTLLGAELMLTPATDAMKDAIARAEEIARTTGDTVIRQQFKNPANPRDSRAPRPRRSGGHGREGDIFVAGVPTPRVRRAMTPSPPEFPPRRERCRSIAPFDGL